MNIAIRNPVPIRREEGSLQVALDPAPFGVGGGVGIAGCRWGFGRVLQRV